MSSHTKKKSDLTDDLMPFAEIGHRLGIPAKTAQTLCYRGMQKIRAAMDQNPTEYGYLREMLWPKQRKNESYRSTVKS